MVAKMMVAHVDVLGSWAKFWESSKLESSRIVLEYFAVDVRLRTDDVVSFLLDLKD